MCIVTKLQRENERSVQLGVCFLHVLADELNYIYYLDRGPLCVASSTRLCWVGKGDRLHREGLCSGLTLTSARPLLLIAAMVGVTSFSNGFVAVTPAKEWKGSVECVDVPRAGSSS